MKVYISFGQVHVHRVDGATFDCDSICSIECDSIQHGREIAMKVFDGKFMTNYTRDKLQMKFFPRGIIALERENR